MLNNKEQNTLKNKDKIKYYIGFSHLLVRPLFKAKLFEYFAYDIKKAFSATIDELKTFSETFDIKIPQDYISKRDFIDLDECYNETVQNKKIGMITFEDEKYPPLLKEIPDFPLALYYRGDIENMDYNYTLAVVGSRKASSDGINALNHIIGGFSKNPIVVVSGLAYGIDAAAHRAALDNNIKTIAVVASGLDIIYPIQNTQLFDEILKEKGVVFSEYPLKTRPEKYNFPQRNRIVVGMSQGTFVVEAKRKSGAMISANLTLDYNRELMCMPGSLSNPNTEGIFHLIKNGAGIVCHTDDIIEQLNWDMKITQQYNQSLDLDENQKRIYDILELEGKTFDTILSEAQTNSSYLMVVLTELELKGLIKQVNNKYCKCIW